MSNCDVKLWCCFSWFYLRSHFWVLFLNCRCGVIRATETAPLSVAIIHRRCTEINRPLPVEWWISRFAADGVWPRCWLLPWDCSPSATSRSTPWTFYGEKVEKTCQKNSWWVQFVGTVCGYSCWWVQLVGTVGGYSWWVQLVGTVGGYS